jgi:hypothetical protein
VGELCYSPAGQNSWPLSRQEDTASLTHGTTRRPPYSTIKLNRCTQADELAMDPLVAEAVLEFGDDLRSARAAADEWAEANGLVHPWILVEADEAA